MPTPTDHPVRRLWDRVSHLGPEAIRFGIVGLTGVACSSWCSTCCATPAPAAQGVLAAKPITAQVIAIGAATVITYLGNRYWTYQHRAKGNPVRELPIFLLLNGIAIAIGAVCLALPLRPGPDLAAGRQPVRQRDRARAGHLVPVLVLPQVRLHRRCPNRSAGRGPGSGPFRGLGPALHLSGAAQDAELVALGIGQHDPAACRRAAAGRRPRWPRDRAAGRARSSGSPSAGRRSRCSRFLPCFSSGTSMNSSRVSAVGREDHALFVTGLVGVVGILGVAEHLRPPDRLGVRVVGVDRQVREELTIGPAWHGSSADGRPVDQLGSWSRARPRRRARRAAPPDRRRPRSAPAGSRSRASGRPGSART